MYWQQNALKVSKVKVLIMHVFFECYWFIITQALICTQYVNVYMLRWSYNMSCFVCRLVVESITMHSII